MKHEWYYIPVKSYLLTDKLKELEEDGWEIFSITYVDYKFLMVICRKEQSHD